MRKHKYPSVEFKKEMDELNDLYNNKDTWGDAIKPWIPIIPFWMVMLVGICLKDTNLTITGAVMYLGIIIDRNKK